MELATVIRQRGAAVLL